MHYKDLIINLSNKFGMPPQEILSFEMAFDTISRLAFVDSLNHLKEVIIENIDIKDKKRTYIYTELPSRLKDTIEKSIVKYGGAGAFYCDFRKPTNLEKFIKNVLDNKIQPKDYWFSGILTYRHLKREPKIDNTVDVVEYKYNEKRL